MWMTWFLVVSNDLKSDDTHLLSSAIISPQSPFAMCFVDMESDKKKSVDEFSCCHSHFFVLRFAVTLNGM